MTQDSEAASTIRIPEGDNWGCAECGETGDFREQTLMEHYEVKHGGI